MLINNQEITLDFAVKETVKVDSFKYKAGEIDKDGIIVHCEGISIENGSEVIGNWLYRTEFEYIYVPVEGEITDEKTLVVRPPQNTLVAGTVCLQVDVIGPDKSLIKSQTAAISVVEALIDDEEATEEDENLSIIVQLLLATETMSEVVKKLNEEMSAAQKTYAENEVSRQNRFSELDNQATSAILAANSAATNADSKANLANTAANNASTAASEANAAASKANTAATSATTGANAANSAATNADSKANLANTAANNASAAASEANTASTSANLAATKANAAADRAEVSVTEFNKTIAEVTNARTDTKGVVHATLKQRLDNEFKDLAKRIPTDIAVSGYETITTNDTLTGDVSGAVATGQTLVNLGGNMKYTAPSGATDVCILTPKQQIKVSTHYTVLLQLKKSNLPTETSYIKFGAGFGEYYMFESSTTPLIFRHDTNETLISLVKTKSVIDNGAYGSLKIPIYFKDIPKDFETEIDIIIIEGDHTDKPLSFFEGLKSAELETVTSHGVNLLDPKSLKFAGSNQEQAEFNSILPLTNCTIYLVNKHSKQFGFSVRNKNKVFIRSVAVYTNKTETLAVGEYFGEIALRTDNGFPSLGNASDYLNLVSLSTIPHEHQSPSSSKTTLETPITLRSLPNGVADTYDFDTQTLTRRCGEVVLNGSGTWSLRHNESSFMAFSITKQNWANDLDVLNRSNSFWSMFSSNDEAYSGNITKEGYAIDGGGNLHIAITKSKLTTPDVSGFKAWLTANPTTVVCQLAEPTTEYIENNGQLRSFDKQTTVSADSIVPVKISGNIPVNYASTLSQTLATIDELTAENRNLKATIAELSENVAGINNFMYRMLAEAGALDDGSK